MMISRSLRTRRGATLTEVLMALLIMSVGIVSTFALFPIAVLSSIKSHQLTHARTYAKNLEEQIRTFPEMLHPPIVSAPAPGNDGVNFRGFWERNTVYAINDVVVPALKPGEFFPSPHACFICVGATGTNRSGPFEPSWNLNAPMGIAADREVAWQELSFSATPAIAALASQMQNYVIDPIGRGQSNAFGISNPGRFGNRDNSTPITGAAVNTLARRSGAASLNVSLISGGTADSTLPFLSVDTRSVLLDVPVLSVAGTNATLPSGVDASGNTGLDAVFYNMNGEQAVFRNITGGTSNVLTIGSTFTLAPFTNVAIEAPDPRYTTFIAVSSNGPRQRPKISIPVIFNRNFSAASEHIYDANFGDTTLTAPVDGALLTNPEDQVVIAWDAATEPAPLIREGNFIFDARACRFYQIASINSSGPVLTSPAVLTLSRPIETRPNGVIGRAVFLPGIVNVYEF